MTKTRRINRANNRALDYFNELYSEFTTTENSNAIEFAGILKHNASVNDKIEELHRKWRRFCQLRTKNGEMQYRVDALKTKIDEYIENKRREIYLLYARQYAFRMFGLTMNPVEWLKIYNQEVSPRVAVRNLIKSTNIMININLSYHRMIIGRVNHSASLPESFDELTPAQFNYFMKLVGQNLTDYELRIKFLRKFFFKLPINRIIAHRKLSEKAKNKVFKEAYYEGYLENSSVVFELIKRLEWLSQGASFTRTPVKKFKGLRGPSDQLKNISIYEFAMCEKEMMDFAATQDPKHVDRLVAVLYRPISYVKLVKSWFNHTDDLRSDYHDFELEARTLKAGKMPMYLKIAILAYFRSVREQFSTTFPEVYGQVRKSSTEDKEGSWADVILEMSGPIAGKEAEVSRVNVYNFLYRINKMIRDNREMNEKLENQKESCMI